jgi:hypothetical protein
MIHEYAVDPALPARWADLRDYRFFMEAFGLGQPRVMGAIPKVKGWRSRALKEAECLPDTDRLRALELVNRLLECVVHRSASFDGEIAWLVNAEAEHMREPFRAILACENPRAHVGVLPHTQIAPGRNPLWDASRSQTPNRNERSLAEALGPMLRIGSSIILVDPHFDASNYRFRNPVEQMLKVSMSHRPAAPPSRVEILAGDKMSPLHFRKTVHEFLPSHTPRGLRVRCMQIAERSGGEKVHQRYVLTDLGGVHVEPGLDMGDGTYDIDLMDRLQYELRWRQYADPTHTFDVVDEPVEITGAAL